MSTGYVYFLKGRGDLIKIGHSRNPRERLAMNKAQLRDSMGTLEFIGCVSGSRDDERFALSQFQHARVAHRRELRRGVVDIPALFPGREVLGLTAFDAPALIQLTPQMHRRLRKRAADERCKLKELTERLLSEALKRKATA